MAWALKVKTGNYLTTPVPLKYDPVNPIRYKVKVKDNLSDTRARYVDKGRHGTLRWWNNTNLGFSFDNASALLVNVSTTISSINTDNFIIECGWDGVIVYLSVTNADTLATHTITTSYNVTPVYSGFSYALNINRSQDTVDFQMEYCEADFNGVSYVWDASASDHSGSTDQPVLTDTAGGNNATGVNFSAYDPNVWVSTGGASETHFLSSSTTQTIGTTASYVKGAELSATVGQAFALDGSYTKFTQLESSVVQSHSFNSAVSKSIQLNDSLGQSTQTSSSYLKVISLEGLCSNPNQTDSSLIKTANLVASIVQSLSLNSDYSKFGFVSGSVVQPSATYGSYFNESNEVHSLASALTQSVVTLSSYNKTAQLSAAVNQPHNQFGDYSKGVNLTSFLSQSISESSLYNKTSIYTGELIVVTQTASQLNKLANVYGQLTQTFTTTGYLFNPDDIQVVQTFLRFDGELLEVRFDGVINEHRQDGSLNTNTQVTLMLYESSYQQFKTAILGHSAADFTNAKYQIFARLGGSPLVEKSLGAGIERTGSEFVTTIQATDITRPGTYYHQFIVYNQDNQPLPPVFAGEIKFNEVK